MATIRKTWAEVLEGSFQALGWPALDDDQKLRVVKHAKRYIGDTTADDVRMTWERFGQAFGVSGEALRKHYNRTHLTRTSADGLTDAERGTLRSVRSLLTKKPGAVKMLAGDEEFAAQVIKGAVFEQGVGPVMHAVDEAYAETPRGKKIHQGITRDAKRREAEDEEAGVTDWRIFAEFLDGPAAQLRWLAERCVEKGFEDEDARRSAASLVKYVRASADMIEMATEGATALTDEDLDLLRGGTR